MCGRYVLGPVTLAYWTALRGFLGPLGIRVSYNVAPTQMVLVMHRMDHERIFAAMRWGLIPSWAGDTRISYRMINARSETVAEKPSFRDAFKRRRCLVLADGYYEWRKVAGSSKQPYYIYRKGPPLAFAGLWERWEQGAACLESCTIITTQANAPLAKIHDRMPVILHPDEIKVWLDSEFQDADKLQKMLRPYSGDDLEQVAVSTLVNNPQNDTPACMEPVKRVE